MGPFIRIPYNSSTFFFFDHVYSVGKVQPSDNIKLQLRFPSYETERTKKFTKCCAVVNMFILLRS